MSVVTRRFEAMTKLYKLRVHAAMEQARLGRSSGVVSWVALGGKGFVCPCVSVCVCV